MTFTLKSRLVATVALAMTACAYSPTGNFTAAGFRLSTYRSIALSAASGDRELTPLPPDVVTAAHEAAAQNLTARGYKLQSLDQAELVLYAGLATVPSKGQALVVRAADRAQQKLLWQRSDVLGEAPTKDALTAAFRKLVSQLPKAADRPVAY